MGFQVSTPTHVSTSRHGGKLPTFELQEIIKMLLEYHESWILIILCGFFCGTLVLRVGVESSFLLDPNFQHKSEACPPNNVAL